LRSDIQAKVLASSISPTGMRLDTLQLRYPRIIHAELMTHRVMSRNASSTRAIPITSFLARDEVFVPEFTKNKPGMQADGVLDEESQIQAEAIWRRMAQVCSDGCAELAKLGVHKQHGGRPLEWFGYIDVVVSATQWSNWDALRDHPAAQPEIQDLAKAIKQARASAVPDHLEAGEWHLPYIDQSCVDNVILAVDSGKAAPLLKAIEFAFEHPFVHEADAHTKLLVCVSAARCCRVSYAKHDGSPSTLEEDINRFCLLAQSTPMHASPLEHQAQATSDFYKPNPNSGNFGSGFIQFRKLIKNECL
jgi:thymidylate synthase ThyX